MRNLNQIVTREMIAENVWKQPEATWANVNEVQSEFATGTTVAVTLPSEYARESSELHGGFPDPSPIELSETAA